MRLNDHHRRDRFVVSDNCTSRSLTCRDKTCHQGPKFYILMDFGRKRAPISVYPNNQFGPRQSETSFAEKLMENQWIDPMTIFRSSTDIISFPPFLIYTQVYWGWDSNLFLLLLSQVCFPLFKLNASRVLLNLFEFCFSFFYGFVYICLP